MPIEIKELVIRTVLEKETDPKVSRNQLQSEKKEGGQPSGNQPNIEREVRKQLKRFRAEIISQCIDLVNQGMRRQQER